jgi:hypothetical protein
MYQARVYKVMIATPGDVATERQVVREAVHHWNDILADDRKLVLLPVGWDTHAHPMMGDRPQAVINKQVLRDCDLLVAVFWTRLGSPTGEAASGTVEEIEEHLKDGKPAMIYFSNAPVRPDSIDEAQYRALREFRAYCESRGLIETFESPSELKDKFGRQLIQLVLDRWAGATEDRPASVGAHKDQPDLQKEAEWYARTSVSEPPPMLSDPAWALLREAAKDKNGTILRLRTMGGLSVQTNGRNFVEDREPRTEARWESVVRELSENGLIQDRGYKNEVFAVTDKGYAAAEQA